MRNRLCGFAYFYSLGGLESNVFVKFQAFCYRFSLITSCYCYHLLQVIHIVPGINVYQVIDDAIDVYPGDFFLI